MQHGQPAPPCQPHCASLLNTRKKAQIHSIAISAKNQGLTWSSEGLSSSSPGRGAGPGDGVAHCPASHPEPELNSQRCHHQPPATPRVPEATETQWDLRGLLTVSGFEVVPGKVGRSGPMPCPLIASTHFFYSSTEKMHVYARTPGARGRKMISIGPNKKDGKCCFFQSSLTKKMRVCTLWRK